MPELEKDSESFDPSARRLCSDGSCIGVIGPEGRCKVCGQPDRGKPADGGYAAAAEPAEDEDLAEEADAPGAGFDPTRKLCVDGSCIGVIGPDGRCTECGRTPET
jgi:hypothetical protein